MKCKSQPKPDIQKTDFYLQFTEGTKTMNQSKKKKLIKKIYTFSNMYNNGTNTKTEKNKRAGRKDMGGNKEKKRTKLTQCLTLHKHRTN